MPRVIGRMRYFGFSVHNLRVTPANRRLGNGTKSIPVGQFANITIGDWRGYDLVAAR